jgi:opacity protein-like surface antigen
MSRFLACAALLLCALASAAAADSHRNFAGQLELGFNTRHFAAADPADVAFRSTGQTEPDPSLGEGTAVTSSLRFTGRARYNTFLGVEAEFGKLVGFDESNVAGAYGVAGGRGDLGAVRLSAELVAGRRWVRYELNGATDPSKLVAEPRIRADLWLSPYWTLGGAVGATLSDRQVWMAGIYIGVHDKAYDRVVADR